MQTLNDFIDADPAVAKSATFGDRIRNLKEGGTFKDSKNAPIHRWFYYPTGFGVNLVYTALKSFNIRKSETILDPFVGSGTTSICAKSVGIGSIGIEAHPFVFQMAKAKLNWNLDLETMQSEVQSFLDKFNTHLTRNKVSKYSLDSVPDLLHRLYTDRTLNQLLIARELLEDLHNDDYYLFFKVALATALRKVSRADTGWPYMLPRKKKVKERSPMKVLRELFEIQLADLAYTQRQCRKGGEAKLIQGDARDLCMLSDESINFAFTSPPYLNNFDYADRTRMEMYFFGESSSWREITEKVRSKLMMSATTQVRRSDWDLEDIFDSRIPVDLQTSLYSIIKELSKRRLTRGGRKSYDIMVGGYFSDMLQISLKYTVY